MNRTWRAVIGFEGLYEVSNDGLVKSLPRKRYCGLGRYRTVRERILKAETVYGYFNVNLHRLMDQHKKKVHRLVADAFIPNPENKPQVNHIDGNKKNNLVENLEWVTTKEHGEHSSKSGLVCSGHRQGLSKLSPKDVSFIRTESKMDQKPGRIARITKKLAATGTVVSSTTVAMVIHNKTYKYK